MRGTGGNAQDRRRTRRAAARRTGSRQVEVFNLAPADVDDIRALVAAATVSTTLPLSSRDTAWDASAAAERVRDWAGATDAPNASYGQAFLLKRDDGASFDDYDLGFADVVDGKLTAVFRGVTAAAGVLQGARGGVKDLSDSEESSLRSRVEGYYSKAAKQYDDAGIKPPWDAAEGESAAALLAYAESVGPIAEGMDDLNNFAELVAYWMDELGGKPNQGTRPDKRLKENKQRAEKTPEDLALEQIDSWRESVDEHPQEEEAREIATAYVKIRPDLSNFAEEVEAIVTEALRRVEEGALRAAAGDVAWGPEDGFVDLLCDVNEILGGDTYSEDGPGYGSSWPRAIDAGVNLDKVLICDGDDYWVAPISIDANGEPVLSEKSEWAPVESGWVETNVSDDQEMGSAAQMRFSLQDIVLAADGATAPEIPDAHQPGERIPARRPSPSAPQASAAADGEIPWTATFVPEGVLTEDGRAFAPGAVILPPEDGSRELPLTLMAMIETSAEGGHDGAKVAGRIDQIWRETDESSGKPIVRAAGVFDKGEYGQDIARMVGDKVLRGLSVDIAPLEWERTPASDWFNEAGEWIATRGDDGEWVPAGAAERSLEDAVEALFSGDQITVITKAVIGMATVCPFPAFGKANIALLASGSVWRYTFEASFDGLEPETLTAAAETAEDEEVGEVEETLTAAAAGLVPVKPPAEWFSDPELEALTPMTITDDGRVFGHAWEWETCHLAFDGCVVAPHSETEYAYFQLGEIECEDGSTLPVGKVTLDAAHAGQRLSRAEATRHYDHTGTVAAHVCFGEDEFGGWFAGAVHPGLSEEKLRLLRGATISGDWRGVNGNLELIALLAVNVPGFPVPRTRYFAAGDQEHEPEVVTLTAAGIVHEAVLTAEEADEIREIAEAA